jgi:hypothetical protein
MAPVLFDCRYCKRRGVARSIQGLKSHISQTPGCRTRRDEEHALLNHNRKAQTASQHAHQQPIEHQQESSEENDIPPSNDTDEHRSKRARVNDDDDIENFRPTSTNFIIDYPAEACAGAVLKDSQDALETRFEKLERAQQHAGEPAWAPFTSLADWELSRWLVRSGVSQREIDKFLKLESVRTSACHANFQRYISTKVQSGARPSAPNKHAFFKKIDSLPKGPEWTCEIFEIKGDHKDENGDAIVEEVELWRRNPVECVRELIGNLAFKDGMKYAPEQHFEDEELKNRVYDEMATGEWWWDVQASARIQICVIYIHIKMFVR